LNKIDVQVGFLANQMFPLNETKMLDKDLGLYKDVSDWEVRVTAIVPNSAERCKSIQKFYDKQEENRARLREIIQQCQDISSMESLPDRRQGILSLRFPGLWRLLAQIVDVTSRQRTSEEALISLALQSDDFVDTVLKLFTFEYMIANVWDEVITRLLQWNSVFCESNKQNRDAKLLVVHFGFYEKAGLIWMMSSKDPETDFIIGIQSMIPYFFASRLRRILGLSTLPSIVEPLLHAVLENKGSGVKRIATYPLLSMVPALEKFGFRLETDVAKSDDLCDLQVAGVDLQFVPGINKRRRNGQPLLNWYVHEIE
jgi:hypothetical protein